MGGHNVNQYIHRLSFSMLVEFNPRQNIRGFLSLFIHTGPKKATIRVVRKSALRPALYAVCWFLRKAPNVDYSSSNFTRWFLPHQLSRRGGLIVIVRIELIREEVEPAER